MKVVSVKKAGGPEVLNVIELPEPVPKEYEVVIEQTFAGINFGDVIRRARGLFELNEYDCYVPGFEGVGKVIAIGNKVKEFTVGDRVSYLNERGGGYSQKICVHKKYIYKVIDSISDQTAAVMTCVGTTAWNLVRISNVQDDDWVIVYGASGGVGLLLMQICLLKGANVIAIVGTKDKEQFVEEYSPTATIVRDNDDVSKRILDITDGKKIDIVFDCVGNDTQEINFNCIRKGGTILYYGSTSGHPNFPGMQILMNSLKIQGFNIFNFVEETKLWKNSINDLMGLLEEDKIKIHIDGIFSIHEVCKAHQLMESRFSKGKLLIDLKRGNN